MSLSAIGRLLSQGRRIWLLASAVIALAFVMVDARANDIDVKPMGNWAEHRTATYRGRPLIIHLRTGYERAILFPEAVTMTDPDQTLPDCDLIIDQEVLGFYPKRPFATQVLKLRGVETGSIFELHVQSSPYGLRQPLQISYPDDAN